MSMLTAALAYAHHGFAVFPVWPAVPYGDRFICGCGRTCDSPAKHPLAAAVRHGLKDASTDERRVRQWFASYPDANIGGVTGQILAIDIDSHHGGEVAAIEAVSGSLPSTWRADTGGGGQHIFFRAEPALGNTRGKLGTGIDTRGVGGYVLLPPSLHVSGRRYAWQPGHAPDDLPLAPLPESIAAALAAPNQAAALTQWRQVAVQDVLEGGRNDTLTRFAGHLLRRYVDPHVVLELLLAWNATRCRPPLSRNEVVTIVNSVAGRELRRREQG